MTYRMTGTARRAQRDVQRLLGEEDARQAARAAAERAAAPPPVTTLEAVRCRTHGATMVQRDVQHQTPEQRWCGVWWDCTEARCSYSVLFPSADLRAQYRAAGHTCLELPAVTPTGPCAACEARYAAIASAAPEPRRKARRTTAAP